MGMKYTKEMVDFLEKNKLSAEYIGYGFKELALIIRPLLYKSGEFKL